MISVFRPLFRPPTPTVEQLTRDVEIKPIHSHNDYWRKRPLYDALLFGCASVEADIWHFDQDYRVGTTTASTAHFSLAQVYVGHNQVYLRPENTIEAMYLEPLFAFVESANKRYSGAGAPQFAGAPFGVFYNAPEAPLYLWLDLKTEGRDLVHHMRARLERFVQKNYLARFDHAAGEHIGGPIVVTLTGNVPWEEFDEMAAGGAVRPFYGDCPLHLMANATDEAMRKYAQRCVFASALLAQMVGEAGRRAAARNGDFGAEERRALARAFVRAHEFGLKTRLWGGVEWPVQVRHQHWRQLWALGCDLLNADDLEAAAGF